MLNESEAAQPSGTSVRDVRAAAEAALALRARGPRHVIVTMGSDRLVIADDRRVRHFAALLVRAGNATATRESAQCSCWDAP